ncbi:MAG: Ig domain-containing protein [Lachnospiraceae bacterium]
MNKKNIIFILFMAVFLCQSFKASSLLQVEASTKYPIILLNETQKNMKIGEEFQLHYISSSLFEPATFKSSNSKVASVDDFGTITAKAAGTTRITVKVKGSKVSCRIRAEATSISLSKDTISLQKGSEYSLKARVSTGAVPSFRSSKSSVAEVDQNGRILGKKAGEAVITVTSDKASVKCKVRVKEPAVKLSHARKSLFRNQSLHLTVKSSSKMVPVYKSSNTSVATVSAKGVVVAKKNGSAIISATVDGVKRTCEITVKKPKITVQSKEITLKCKKSSQLQYTVNSGNKPQFTSSNCAVAIVDENGNVQGIRKGTAQISIKEDGAKAVCVVTVTD